MDGFGWLRSLLLLVFIPTTYFKILDYWSDDFDKEANCKSEKEMVALGRVNQCTSAVGNTDTDALQNCKNALSPLLMFKCQETQVQTGGDFFFCKKRGNFQCCFANHTCQESWGNINDKLVMMATDYLTDKDRVLEKLKREGYKSCHHIGGYDASACAEDCAEYEKSEFARNCSLNGKGLFKCCIRRDKRFCDECRFCCTLPFCTQENGKVVVEPNQYVTNSQMNLSAIEKMYPLQKMYKDQDYRCYDPKSSPDPTKWKFYDNLKDFKETSNATQFQNLKLQEFDHRILNFEDPKVFEMAIGAGYKKFWKEVYGFDFVNYAQDVKIVNGSILDVGQTDTIAYCLRSENKKFARQCRKNNGFFKCCTGGFRLDIFNQVRQNLYKKDLIKVEPDHVCGPDFTSKKCQLHTALQMCTYRDSLTGERRTEFRTKLEDKFHVGGTTIENNQNLGLRLLVCSVMNTCTNDLARPLVSGPDFEKAMDRNSLCKTYIQASNPKDKKTFYNTDLPAEDNQMLYELFRDNCNSTKHTVFICPDKDLAKKLGNEKENTIISNLAKKIKKDKTMKKKRRKKKASKVQVQSSEGGGVTEEVTEGSKETPLKQNRSMATRLNKKNSGWGNKKKGKKTKTKKEKSKDSGEKKKNKKKRRKRFWKTV